MKTFLFIYLAVLQGVIATGMAGQSVNANLACGQFEEYRVCGPKCPPTCDTLKDTVCCEVKCVPGCFCKDGYLLLKNGLQKCVPTSGCPKPGILKFEERHIYALERDNVFRIAVVRVNGSYGEVRVRWRIVFKNVPTLPFYIGRSGELIFPDGVTRQVIEIPIVDNTIRGSDISFHVELFEPSYKTEIVANGAYSVLTIKDDDMTPGYLEIERNDYYAAENIGKLVVGVVRKDGTDGQIRVKYKTKGISALVDKDFLPTAGELIFEEGEVRKSIFIDIVNDEIREPTKTFEIDLYDPVAGEGILNFRGLGFTQTSLVTITDDDMKPGYFEVEKTNYVVSESVGSLQVGILRVGGTDGQIRIRYKTLVKSAVAITDFIPVEGVVVFEEGEVKKAIDIKIIDDNLREPTKTFEILLFDPAPGPGVINFRNHEFQQSVTVTITDDDMKPGYFILEKPSFTVPEDIGVLRINVLRVDGSDGQVRVHYKTIVKTALASADFIPVTGELVFEEGETSKYVDIVIIDDDVREPSKVFEIQLYDPTPGVGVINFRGLGSLPASVVTITDNDMKPGYFELEKLSYTVPESAGVVKVGVLRVGGSDGEIHIRYKTIAKTAIVDLDFAPVTGELIFQDGEVKKYIDIQINNDDLKEPTKMFEIQLYDPTPGVGVINFRSMASQLISSITITDDDMTPGYFVLEKANYVISENIGSLKIGVLRLGGVDGQVTIRYKTVVKTAVVGKDFSSVHGEIVFLEGENKKYIDIPIIDDDIREPSKTFEIMLYDPAAGESVINFRGLGPVTTALITINDDDMKPGVLEIEKATYSALESDGFLKMGVVRTGGTDGTIRVKYKMISKTLVNFLPIEGELLFEEGVTKRYIEIPIPNDNIAGPSKVFEIQLLNPEAADGVINFRGFGTLYTSQITIMDDDVKPGFLQMEQATITVAENAGTIHVAVIRVDGSDGQIRAKYRVISVTAHAISDYVFLPGELVFNNGETRKSIPITIINDNIREPTESFRVELFNQAVSPGVFNFRNHESVVVTEVIITDDDINSGVLEVEKENIVVTEDAGAVSVAIVRKGGSDGRLTVRYRTVDLTALAGTDYIAVDGEITFADGEVRKVINIRIINDNIKESVESFTLELIDPTNRILGSLRRILIAILDNDKSPGIFQFIHSRITVFENQPKLTLTIVRRGGSDGTVTLQCRTKDRTATEGQDYKPLQGSVSFNDGEVEKSISIDIIDDNLKENDEEFLVGLFNPTNGGVLGPINTVIVTIKDNDFAEEIKQEESVEIFFVRKIVRIKRSVGKVRLHVRRTGDLKPLTIFLTTKDGSARGNIDYRKTRGEITFFENEIELTVELRLTNRTVPSGNRRFFVEISRPSRGIIVPTRNMATVIIENDTPSVEISGRLAGSGDISVDGIQGSMTGSQEFRVDGNAQSLPQPLSIVSAFAETPGVQHQTSAQVITKFVPQEPPPGMGQHEKQTCPPGMTFKLCAPTCPKTCQTMHEDDHCQKKCINACFCPEGQVIENLDSLKCIPPEDCAGFRSFGKIAAIGSAAAGLLGGLNLGAIAGVG